MDQERASPISQAGIAKVLATFMHQLLSGFGLNVPPLPNMPIAENEANGGASYTRYASGLIGSLLGRTPLTDEEWSKANDQMQGAQDVAERIAEHIGSTISPMNTPHMHDEHRNQR